MAVTHRKQTAKDARSPSQPVVNGICKNDERKAKKQDQKNDSNEEQKQKNDGKEEQEQKNEENEVQEQKNDGNKKQTSSGLLSRAKRIAILFIKGITLVCIVPPLLNYSALSRESRELLPAEAEMIEVAPGQKLMKLCIGTGKPTVILDAGEGFSSDSWMKVQEVLAKTNRVCVYDRAGLGFSDRPFHSNRTSENSRGGGMQHTVETMMDDFQQLFSSEERPFVLVGVDQGGLVVKFYAQMFPESVAALVLINPLFEGLFLQVVKETPWMEYWSRVHLPALQLRQMSAAVGITRFALQFGLLKDSTLKHDLPDVAMNRRKHVLCKPAHLSSTVKEAFHLNESLTQMRFLRKLRPFPEHMPATLVWTKAFQVDMSDEQLRYWQSTQEAVKRTLGGNDVRTVHLGKDLEDLLFVQHNTLMDHVKQVIGRWRTRPMKETAKF